MISHLAHKMRVDEITLVAAVCDRRPRACECYFGAHRAPLQRLSILGRDLELRARNSAELKQANERLFNQVVRTGCAGGDADNGAAVWQPISRDDFALLMQIVMLDLVAREQTRGVEHKIGGQLFLAHFGEVRSIRAVVTAHDEQKIQWDIQQLTQCILAFLGGAANGVEKPEVFLLKFLYVAIGNRLPNA